MDYQEFIEKLGNITIPEGEIKEKLIHGVDSIHFVGVIGKVVGGEYEIYDPINPSAVLCLETISLLESRGAVREEDYIVTCNLEAGQLRLAVHSTHKFLSDEDFNKNIKRYSTK